MLIILIMPTVAHTICYGNQKRFKQTADHTLLYRLYIAAVHLHMDTYKMYTNKKFCVDLINSIKCQT